MTCCIPRFHGLVVGGEPGRCTPGWERPPTPGSPERTVGFGQIPQDAAEFLVEKLGETFADGVAAGFRTFHRQVALSGGAPKTALNETWDVTVYAPITNPKPMYIFDLVIHQECASDIPLILPKYHYGGLGFRGSSQWTTDKKNRAAENCFFLTSEGKTRANGNETKGRWCHISGKTDGEMLGVAILDHPSNFRSPQGMRLNPDIPFFCYCPSQDGDWEITPQKPYNARYRFIVSEGSADKDLIERLYTDWANPPKAEVK